MLQEFTFLMGRQIKNKIKHENTYIDSYMWEMTSRKQAREFHGGPVVKTLVPGAQVWFLVGEPRSHMLYSMAKIKEQLYSNKNE